MGKRGATRIVIVRFNVSYLCTNLKVIYKIKGLVIYFWKAFHSLISFSKVSLS